MLVNVLGHEHVGQAAEDLAEKLFSSTEGELAQIVTVEVEEVEDLVGEHAFAGSVVVQQVEV